MENTKTPEWVTQQISCGPFEGIIKTKESVQENGDLFTHIVYSLTDPHTGESVMGIGSDIDEVGQRIANEINKLREND